MKIAYISTYPPRQCGIATYSYNLISSIENNRNCFRKYDFTAIVAIDNEETPLKYQKEVKYVIRQNIQKDYISAAEFINLSSCDVCVLEHEFGIFGGDNGLYILSLLNKLKIPLIVTLHTITDNLTKSQRYIIEQIGKIASKIIVMSRKAINFLETIYNIPHDKIAMIEHGVPDFRKVQQDDAKKKYHLEDRKLILTFGLISRNKGIETVIESLPAVVKKYPETLYLICGNTHPEVLKRSGEEYKNYLNLLIKKSGLEKNVSFDSNFLSEQKIFKYLYACDIFVTPYKARKQITSGTLSYALGAGAAIISTPYWHAEEVLTDGRGILFDFGDSRQLSEIIINLFDNPDKLRLMRKKSYEYGKNLKWSIIGKKYLNIINSVVKNFRYEFSEPKSIIDTSLLPDFDLEHIKRLTDDTGIVQHARYSIPNLKEGYCIDDNSRALLMTMMAYNIYKDNTSKNLLPIYLRYINYMQNPDGSFRNFLSFNRQFTDRSEGSEDSFGRTIWAIGYLIRFAPYDAYYLIGKEIFEKASKKFTELKAPRAIADTLLGISHYLQREQQDETTFQVLKTLTKKLTDFFEKNKKPDWHWFEDMLTYDNGILPLSLFQSYEITHDEYVLDIAKSSMEFLESVTMPDGHLSIIGNKKWYKYGKERSKFNQQAVDALAMVLLFYEVYIITGDDVYLYKMYRCFLWFFGENDMNKTMYDYETKGCFDGLHEDGANRNEGAESTLAYLISYLTLINALEAEHSH